MDARIPTTVDGPVPHLFRALLRRLAAFGPRERPRPAPTVRVEPEVELGRRSLEDA